MSTSYSNLGMRRGYATSLDATSRPHSNFERQLHEVEAGASALNLSCELVHLAAEVAAFEANLDDDRRIALILLIVASLVALQEGSTRLPVIGPQSVASMRRLLGPLCGDSFGVDSIERMRFAIEDILISGSASGVIGTNANDYKPLVYLPPFLYQHRIVTAEIMLAQKLTSLLNAQMSRTDEARIAELLSELNSQSAKGDAKYTLSEEQRIAVGYAAAAPLTIISGGPGTGKTSIVMAILEVLTRAGIDPGEIALAAPTGKAANRIAESIRASLLRRSDDVPAWKTCPEPATVHRLLGYSPTQRRFRYHRNNPLSARVVIVDEGSMLDLELMSHLLDALRPDARLVILGDADQLPSVSAGAIFRDLLPEAEESGFARPLRYARLTRSYRTESGNRGGDAVFKLASAINAGDLDLSASVETGGAIVARRTSPSELDFVGAEWLDEEALSGSFLERWFAAHLRSADDLKNRTFSAVENGFAPSECESLRRVFEKVAQSRILCITRMLESGSERVNALLHRRFAYESGVSAKGDRFMAGEPVMMLRNDYERMLFNGDQGVVLQVRLPGSEAAPMAVFPRGDNFVAFRIDALKEHLELCYAMTVHKAQGSEFEAVVVILPDKDIPILTREILYTAVSRARRSVTIVGSGDIIRVALARRIERYSGLREQLGEQLGKSLSESHRA